MPRSHSVLRLLLAASALLAPAICRAQFDGSITGVVQDPSGAAVPEATLTLSNNDTHLNKTGHSDKSGNYRFLSLAPGTYTLSTAATGFSASSVQVTLSARQVQEIPVTLAIGSATSSVQVTTETPLLDPAETRTDLTLSTQALTQLPIAGIMRSRW